jgi:hypothetical protein
MGQIDTGLLVGIIGVVGTLLGTLLGSLLEMWRERTRWRREKQVRYNAERIQAYNHFLGQVSEFISRVGIAQGSVIKSRSSTEEITNVYYTLGPAFERVKLLSTPAIAAAAEELFVLCAHFLDLSSSPEKRSANYTQYRELQSKFYKAAQKELDLQ